ncbi:MAG: endo-1,4-beta-xylanase [Phycisphaerales bacterium]|nr:endo-1,4-beta-xylanase [Phycisphaerales bacterium]
MDVLRSPDYYNAWISRQANVFSHPSLARKEATVQLCGNRASRAFTVAARIVYAIALWMMVSGAGVVFAEDAKMGLKDVYRDFGMGVAIPPPRRFKAEEMDLIKAQFNALTPENCMKPESVHPAEKVWRFEDADALVDFAQKNHMQVYGHTLVWHLQTPEWFFKDGDKPASRELALARMKEHITTLVGRYKGEIRGWDVVNEAISQEQDVYLRYAEGGGGWLKAVGPDYVEQAFRFAHEADPNAELQYNDYGIEMPVKRQKAIKLVQSLLDKGIPVASIGIQCHFRLDRVPMKELEDAIVEFSELNGGKMKVAITELDLDVLPRQAQGADPTAVEAANVELQKVQPCPPEVLQRQAEQYAALFALFEKHKESLVRVTFWGLNDGHTWLNAWPTKRYNHPLLWDRTGKAKPAYEAVMEAKR